MRGFPVWPDADFNDERERAAAVAAHRQREIERELEANAMAQAERFARIVLTRLASPEVESRLVELLVDDWEKLPDEEVSGLRTAARSQVKGTITTSFPLSAVQRRRLQSTLEARLGQALDLDYREDPQLLAGIRLSLGHWRLHLSLADELSSFAAAGNHAP